MMKALFRKSSVVQSEFRQARQGSSSVWHIQRSEGHPLCGSRRVMKSTWVVTEQEVLNSVHTQNSGFQWCADCGSAFTGANKSIFQATRFRVQLAS